MDAAFAAMEREPLIQPQPLILSPGKLQQARDDARGAAAIARWCWHRADELPWWAWRRRARFRWEGVKQARFAEMMWQTFGTGK